MSILKDNQGFSLLEITAVVGIVVASMTAISSLVLMNIRAENLNENFLIASMLAQEGLEIVRNQRDRNWLDEASDWKQGTGPQFGSTDILQDGHYTAHLNAGGGPPTMNRLVFNVSDPSCRLYLNGGWYSHAVSAVPTDFYRLIRVSDGGDYIQVNAEVFWRHRDKDNTYTASTRLYNWR